MASAINEIELIGRSFRKLIDQASNKWAKFSFWTKAQDVEFDDGKTAEQKVGGINGITSDVSRSDENIASSILPVHNIKSNLDQGIINEHIQLVIDDDGNLGWKKDGADTVYPFSRKAYLVGEINNTQGNVESNSPNTYTFSCTNLPRWEKLTTSDFVMKDIVYAATKPNHSDGSATASTKATLTLTYDSSTGTLKVLNCRSIRERDNNDMVRAALFGAKIYAIPGLIFDNNEIINNK